jgi:hypothetical protein
MIKFLFKRVYGPIDVIAMGVIMLIEVDYNNPLLTLLFIPWAAISELIKYILGKREKP